MKYCPNQNLKFLKMFNSALTNCRKLKEYLRECGAVGGFIS